MRLAGAFAWSGAALFAGSLIFFIYSYLVVFGRPAPAGGPLVPILLNVALFSAFAMHHSLLARTRVREMMRTVVSPRLERAVYTWTASLLFVAVCWLWRPVPGTAYEITGGWRWLGLAAQAAGVFFTWRGSSAIDVLDLAGVRQAVSHGPERRAALETTGVYALVRHPIYLGWALLVFGAPSMTGTRLTFAIVSTAYLAIAVPWEERSLLEMFGSDYEAYRRRVRWRMLPWIY